MRRRVITGICVAVLWMGAGARPAGPTGVWLDVPFLKQEKDGCGAASIAMVMEYWAAQTDPPSAAGLDPHQIQLALYSPEAKGIYASAMEHYLQQKGFRTFSFRGSWEDLRDHLLKGRPLIVSLQPRGGGSELHYVVVAGLDWEDSIIFLNDPARRKFLRLERSEFEKEWKKAGNWTLLALPLKSE